MLDLTEAVDFVSSTGILFVCDFLVLGTLVFYIVWFNLNARSRFSDEDCSGREPLVQQAHYLKKDWCRGSLIFAGWHRVTQGAPLIFSLMVGTVKNLAHFSDSLISPPSGAATPPAESRPDSASSPTRSRPRT